MADPVFNDPITNPFGLSAVGFSASPVFVDIDGDGDQDAFIGNSAGETLFFLNTGSSTAPNFALQTGNFGLTDVGFSADPSFADIDDDGDLDAFIGNKDGSLVFFRNNGDVNSPSFAIEANTFGLTDAGSNAAPCFADIDDDGDLDAFVGERFGNILFFRNNGDAANPDFVSESNTFGLADVGGFAKPAFVDIDLDGDLDAYVGRSDGNSLFFRNTGNASAPNFVQEADNLGLVDAGFFASPNFADVDGDGDLDAMVGNLDGNILYFENNAKPILVKPDDITYSDTRFDDTFTSVSGSLSASDSDDNVLTYSVAGGVDKPNGTSNLTNAYGTLTVNKTTGAYSFTAKDGAIEALLSNVSTAFTVTVSDGVSTDSKVLNLNITQDGITESNGNNTLTGTTGNDKFNALAGNDTIDGLAGADTMRGGLGNDSYIIDNVGDTVIESSALSTEIDQVESSISYTLGMNVENLTLSGTTAITGAGNLLNNVIIGNSAANILNGKAGADTMTGGLGNDSYFVDNIGDRVIETSALTTEIDRVQSSISYTLKNNFENLQLTGSNAINGFGNALINVMTGNSNNNILNGYEGNDTLTGGLGKDSFRLTTLSKDKITDFSVADDTIQLENGVFTALLTTGVLSAGSFKIGAAAADANDYILYNSVSGVISYDSDGNGDASALQIAVVGAGLALSNTDFVVI